MVRQSGAECRHLYECIAVTSIQASRYLSAYDSELGEDAHCRHELFYFQTPFTLPLHIFSPPISKKSRSLLQISTNIHVSTEL